MTSARVQDASGPVLTTAVCSGQWRYGKTNPAFPSDSLGSADFALSSGKRCHLTLLRADSVSESLTLKAMFIGISSPPHLQKLKTLRN